MLTLKNVGLWILAHWYFPLFICGIVLGIILFRKNPKFSVQALTNELAAIQAKYTVSKVQAEQGLVAAQQHIQDNYKLEMADLTDQERKQAESLKANPAALAKFLVQAAGNK